MGARTNYTIITTDNPLQNINVYSHWDGEQSVHIMQHALDKAMARLGDDSYFVRILIDNITADGRDSATGYGIYIGDEVTHEEEYDYKEINLINQTVTVGQMTMAFTDFLKAVA